MQLDFFLKREIPVHKITLLKLQRTIPNANITPDIKDANFYCKSYQYTYKNRHGYRHHLKVVHKMVIAPLRRKPIFDPSICVDNTNNPNNASCADCKFIYSSKYEYQKHLKTVHKHGKKSKYYSKSQHSA